MNTQGVTSNGHMTFLWNNAHEIILYKRWPVQSLIKFTFQSIYHCCVLTWELCCCPIICPDGCVRCCFWVSLASTWEVWEDLCVFCVCCKGILHNCGGGMTMEAWGSGFANWGIGGFEVCWTGYGALWKLCPPMGSPWSDTSLQQVKQKKKTQA